MPYLIVCYNCGHMHMEMKKEAAYWYLVKHAEASHRKICSPIPPKGRTFTVYTIDGEIAGKIWFVRSEELKLLWQNEDLRNQFIDLCNKNKLIRFLHH